MKKGFICLTVITALLFNSLILFGKDDIIKEKSGKERLTVPLEWCDKIGMRDVMMEMKTTSQLLGQTLLYRKWDQVNRFSTKLKALYDGLQLENTNVPEEYWEFNEDYLRYFNRFLKACEEKNGDDADFQFKRVKTACHHCHIRFVRRKSPDTDVGLERLYKEQFKEWGDGKSVPNSTGN